MAGPSGSGSFQYTYEANSNLIASITGPTHTVTNTWEPTRNVLDIKENKVGSIEISSYDYSVNSIGQRTSVATSGTAFSGAAGWNWAYDAYGQVTLAEHGTNSSFHRSYDAIGNRLKTAESLTLPTTNNYTPNALNQYDAVGAFNPTYDDDGNQIDTQVLPLGSSSLESCVFAWDIHNELITATTPNGDTAQYQYDALGRRTKRIETVSSVTTTTFFLYNGWNVELEHDGTAYTRRMTWGLDVAGASGSSSSMQGAGGVGGLIMTEDLPPGPLAPIPHFPTYDGNGNITAWVDSNGTVVARQRYDAFGNIIHQTGTAPSNYGFSTKPMDQVTGLLYYGYRWYDPVTGRWPSRDPIEEDGGINLYGFVENDGVNQWDYLGLMIPRRHINCACRRIRTCAECEMDFKFEGQTVNGTRPADDPHSECSSRNITPDPQACDPGTVDMGITIDCWDR